MPYNKHSSSEIVSGVCGVVAPLLGLTGLWSSRIHPHPAVPAEYFGVQSAGPLSSSVFECVTLVQLAVLLSSQPCSVKF